MSQVRERPEDAVYQVDKIVPAPWNVNVMDEATFRTLVEDMKEVGPKGIDPIHVAEFTLEGATESGIYTVDGAQRLQAARKIGWKEVPVFYHNDIKTEEQARLFNYRRDAERGQIDQFRLAESFKWFQERGKTQKQIADSFGIDVSTVSKRMSLLNLDKDLLPTLMKANSASVSHLETISTLAPELQRKVVTELTHYASPGAGLSVKAMEDQARQVKQEYEAHQKFKEAVAEAKFPICPITGCGKKPRYNRWSIELPWVHCMSGSFNHEWSLNTGKLRHEIKVEDRSAPKNLVRAQVFLDSDFGSPLSMEHFKTASLNFARRKFEHATRIDSFEIEGFADGQEFELRIDLSAPAEKTKTWESEENSFEYQEGDFGKRRSRFYVTAKYPKKSEVTPENQTIFASVVASKVSEVKKIQADVVKFLTEYGARGKKRKLPRGKKAKK